MAQNFNESEVTFWEYQHGCREFSEISCLKNRQKASDKEDFVKSIG